MARPQHAMIHAQSKSGTRWTSFGHLRRSLGLLPISALTLAAALWIGASAGCGGDDDDGAAPVAQAGTSGGSGGRAGSTATSGGPAVPPPQPVQCGSATCNPPVNPISQLLGGFGAGAIPQAQACCIDESEGTCGVAAMTGAACEPPAVADKRCPALNLGMLGGLAGGGGAMQGCCINNQCGQDGALFGRGCVQNSEVRGLLGGIPLVGMTITPPPPQACDAPPPAGADGGVDDGGVSDDAGL